MLIQELTNLKGLINFKATYSPCEPMRLCRFQIGDVFGCGNHSHGYFINVSERGNEVVGLNIDYSDYRQGGNVWNLTNHGQDRKRFGNLMLDFINLGYRDLANLLTVTIFGDELQTYKL